MLRQTLDSLALFSPRFRRVMMRTWYESLVVLDREKQITFMNYGYAELDTVENPLPLDDEENVNRYAIQLYHHVTAPIDLNGKDVAEIGSGRGGGAAYISRNRKPKSMIGIDISKNAVDFCNKYYSNDVLSFSRGDAEHIPLADNSVDAVINVESSHCYGSMSGFLGEVRRVLRPGGYFLFTDHRDHDQMPVLQQQLNAAGLETKSETDITANVVRALELDNDRKQLLLRDACPRLLRKEAGEFAALVGSRAYESFRSRRSRYFSFALSKNGQA
jgi:ubiquinone/menaquinone biosynthesis C-methylase UbiE